ncbi:MAG: hypothetical protein ACJAQ0_001547, partial [Dasania sp.]
VKLTVKKNDVAYYIPFSYKWIIYMLLNMIYATFLCCNLCCKTSETLSRKPSVVSQD